MDKTAYNFYNSRKIETFAETPVVSEITDMTHLYSNKPFIAIQKFHRFFFTKKIFLMIKNINIVEKKL